jgi:hypothetical protein
MALLEILSYTMLAVLRWHNTSTLMFCGNWLEKCRWLRLPVLIEKVFKCSFKQVRIMFSHLKIYINMKAGWKSYSKEWVAFSLLTVSITYAFHLSLIRETLVVASLHNVPSNALFPLYYLHCTCIFVSLRCQPLVVTNVHNSVPLIWLQNLLSVSIVCQTLVEASSTRFDLNLKVCRKLFW